MNMIQKAKEQCINCNLCSRHCDFLDKYQMNLRDFALKPQLASSCFLCDKCKSVCPKDLSGKEIALLHRKNSKNQPRIGAFLKKNYMFKNTPKKYSETLLFLGCNYPGYYPKTCERLIEICQDRGIDYSIDCCKKPLLESGLAFAYEKMRGDFKARGLKRLICACPNCYYTFKKHLKGIEILNVYRFIRKEGIGSRISEEAHVFFPCSDRYDGEIFEDIKFFLSASYKDTFQEVNCCGLGGNARKKEGDLLDKISEKMHGYHAPSIYTYCSSCAGIFTSYGLENVKNCLSEILDVHEQVSRSYVKNIIKGKLKRRKHGLSSACKR